MFTEIYIEALLVNDELADQFWDAWDKGEIDDQIAWIAWWYISISLSTDIDLGAYRKQFD